MHSEEFWELALAVNAAVKGLLGSMGESGHICSATIPINTEIQTDKGWPGVVEQLITALDGIVRSGDVIVLADKIVGIAQGRIGPRSAIQNPDPKTVDASNLRALATTLEKQLGFRITPQHALLGDEYEVDLAVFGADDHNQAAHELAIAIDARLSLKVDVIISDTDTGLDVRFPLIGMVTIGATPLGATGGLNIYEAMRCSVAAEFTRGHTRRIPAVVCRPAKRRLLRPQIGTFRGYAGMIDVTRETVLSHA